MLSQYSIKICGNNPYRWYISFKQTEPLSLTRIKSILAKENYQTLASTQSVMVFQSNSIRLTWHSHGLLQVDYIDKQKQNIQSVDDLVNQLIHLVSQE